jgi:hypothetical protein
LRSLKDRGLLEFGKGKVKGVEKTRMQISESIRRESLPIQEPVRVTRTAPENRLWNLKPRCDQM